MNTFNFEEALKQLQSGKKLTGTDGILTPLIKQLTEAALQAELEQHLQQEESPANRKNGYTCYRDWETDRKSTRLNSSHRSLSRMPSSA